MSDDQVDLLNEKTKVQSEVEASMSEPLAETDGLDLSDPTPRIAAEDRNTEPEVVRRGLGIGVIIVVLIVAAAVAGSLTLQHYKTKGAIVAAGMEADRQLRAAYDAEFVPADHAALYDSLADIANAPGVTKKTAQLAGGVLRAHFSDGRVEADEIAQAKVFIGTFVENPGMSDGDVKAFIEAYPEFEDMAKPARRRFGY